MQTQSSRLVYHSEASRLDLHALLAVLAVLVVILAVISVRTVLHAWLGCHGYLACRV